MNLDIRSITPVRPNDVGDVRFELRVELSLGDALETIDVTAEELIDYRKFQQVALAKTGNLLNVGLSDCANEFDAYRRWQTTLQNAKWQRESGSRFDEAHETSPDDQDEPSYKLAD